MYGVFGFYGWGSAIVLFQIFCIVHAVKTGRTSWIWLILFFPLLGCIFYLTSEVRVGGGRKLAGQIVDVVQPSRRLQALRAEVEACPSVENRLALADECARHKLYDEALQLYDSASTGVHNDDPAVLKGRAAVQLEMGKAEDARATLEHLFKTNPRDRTPATRLLFARIVEAQGDSDETLQAYDAASTGAIGDEVRCRYAGALERAGRTDDAFAIYSRIVKESSRADSRYRRDNREWIQIAKTKLDASQRKS
jgi:hypothetical protein